MLTILVSAATANTAGTLVHELSQTNSVNVHAFVRDVADPRVSPLAALPNVTLVKGDFDDKDSVDAALKGVDRAFLVSSCFTHDMFERECNFIESAARHSVPVVKVGTATVLTHPGSRTAYGRNHYCIEAFAQVQRYKVVVLRPNWFMDNLLAGVEEVKASGKLSYPCAGDGNKMAMVDPRDVARAAATILLADESKFNEFLQERAIEVHGPEMLSLAEEVQALSDGIGYDVKIQAVPPTALVDVMVSFGMVKVFAEAFCNTILKLNGDIQAENRIVNESSALLTASGWSPKYTVKDWAQSKKIQGAFAR
ncbi:hypothetical protein SARC_00287 [Sphaeroforma arctica JP610]|uniref:NmrA-like domain-containing protein n=1 Tax=Sphaeroforma arctica JP610 TaxID=667725 RepID=A0A0L0GEZ0_9EUKA|nr:hypothetical protein SARC_00287 [Sphaeroforma arctica JP610]KNC87585.1 hypothetical protein SARC_00287 [Sphaeroforma arctica JP610]|eukprot:XP_014161487.1 hypothetical protein SARC_00287 [Sphaeroforma arctica JP610]